MVVPGQADGSDRVRRHTDIGGHHIHSVHTGAGPAVVLLHGLSGSRRWWRLTVPALAARFSVHIPELAGFGRSRAASVQPDIAASAGLVAEWIETLGIGRTHLVGHSMGGQIAIHLAARRPDRTARLVLAAPTGIPHDRSLSEAARLLSEVVRPRAWGALSFIPTMARDALRAGPRVLATAAYHLFADDVRPLLPEIPNPTLVVWGEHDPLVPLEHGRLMERELPDARLRVIRGGAHNIMADRPEAFNDAVLGFLSGED